MKFLREDKSAAVHAIAKTLCDGLADGKRVLWLVSGGSNIGLEKQIMDMLHQHAEASLGSLAILPIDERYGHPGHADSNAEQLRAAGFAPGSASFVDVLAHDVPLDQTVSFYTDVLTTALNNASLVVAQIGMGADGHIGGIKQRSPAAIDDASTVVGYKWGDYTRLTLMPAALRQVNKAYVVTYGDDKKAPLMQLRDNQGAFAGLPALLLYELPDVTIYNDEIGETQ